MGMTNLKLKRHKDSDDLLWIFFSGLSYRFLKNSPVSARPSAPSAGTGC